MKQTDAAEVEALAWSAWPELTAYDARSRARAVLASDWLAAREAAAYQRGRDEEFNERLSFGIESGALTEYMIAAAEARGAERALREAAEEIHPEWAASEWWSEWLRARAAAAGGAR